MKKKHDNSFFTVDFLRSPCKDESDCTDYDKESNVDYIFQSESHRTDCCRDTEYKKDIEDIMDAYVFYNPSIETEKISGCKHYPHIEQKESFLSLCSVYLS